MEIIYFLGEPSVELTQGQHKTPFIIPLKIKVSTALVKACPLFKAPSYFLFCEKSFDSL